MKRVVDTNFSCCGAFECFRELRNVVDSSINAITTRGMRIGADALNLEKSWLAAID